MAAGDGDIKVPGWRDMDLDVVSGKADVLAFDLDNTLALSKTRMDEVMARHFAALTHLRPVAIISGGRFLQFRNQVLAALPEDTDRTQLHLMPTSGTRYYRWKDNDWGQVYAHDLSDEDRKAAAMSLEKHARELGDWEEETWGPRIEDRGSQITFSALGQEAPVGAKEAWDPDNKRKDRLAAAVAADLPHLQVRSGGSTSVDISAKGIDKAYAVSTLAEILGVQVDRILFVGDRMDPDGNDYPAALAGTLAVKVDNPADTLELIRTLEPRLAR